MGVLDFFRLNASPFFYIASGISVTLSYALISLFFGVLLGSLIAIIRKIYAGKILDFIFGFYVSLFRGTPLLVQIMIIYWVLPELLGFDIGPFVAGLIAFSLNSSAYVSEIIKSGINAIDPGQFEAAEALNIGKFATMHEIILPQVMKNILPALVNEMVDLVKESSIVSMIGALDIMKRAQNVASVSSSYMQPLLIAALYYYVIVQILTYLATRLEKKNDQN